MKNSSCDELEGVDSVRWPLPLSSVDLSLSYSPLTKSLHLVGNGHGGPDLNCPVGHSGSSSPSTNNDTASLVSSVGAISLDDDPPSPSLRTAKKSGLSSFLSSGVFGWKGKNAQERWFAFGKDNLRSCSEDRPSSGQNGVLGSTGLIQLDRPSGLPAKSQLEREAHSFEHDQILSSARKKELKAAKQRKKKYLEQLKVEDQLAQATRIWSHEILPKWSTMRHHKKTLDLWWEGIPPCVRGKVWILAISNDLNITRELYRSCLSRAKERLRRSTVCCSDPEDPESSMELIQLDISRTFPNLCIFQKSGPYYEMLHSLLAAYVTYRPDVGYVQGMSFIAAVLILNMDAEDAFSSFANLLNRPLHRAFYTLDQTMMKAYYITYEELLAENLPKLSAHLVESELSPDLYMLDWVYTLYAKAMPLDIASRIWDVFLRDGEQFFFRAAIGVLKLLEDQLLSLDFLGGSKLLTRLPDNIDSVALFKAISTIKMTSSKNDFETILARRVAKGESETS